MKIGDYTNSNQNYYLDSAQKNASKALENISAQRALSGTDSSNLLIADSLRSSASSISQGVNNANDAIGVLQIADATLQNLGKGADRLNELSVRANSAINGPEQISALNKEANALKTSMQDSLNSASFNGKNIFGNSLSFQTGNGEVGINLAAPNVNSLDISNQNTISDFLKSVNSLRTDIGSLQNGLISGINASLTAVTSTKASESQLQNNDLANNVNNYNNANLLVNSSTMAAAHNMQTLQRQVSGLLG
ncbi:flagellin [Campylobacter fetus]|uniref:flagellin n=1 Tax=Campylobacter fetus TaxID=196 RepID=UPI00050909D1|nr:flagellin [Campylobacter fetus]WKW17834.1 flagellin [Campylobacter fetus subsp. fetus]AIR78453.1 flagellar secreted protein [Campylobacter fetus subsp. fetus 04/554]EAJ5694052.1 flagellin [Campylobacter fetus]EAJ5705004.1 flagellin [Campylobacter fetus]EAJ9257390.1 flagellin [Campylobacter fetus]